MYNIIQLKHLKSKPKINDISLHLLCEYYEVFLNPFIDQYEIEFANHTKKKLKLKFELENFCHLLGLESVAKNSVKSAERFQYKGKTGWNNVKTGKIDIKHLKQLKLEKPLAVIYERSKVYPPTKIECKLLLYNTCDNVVVHLGIEETENDGENHSALIRSLPDPSENHAQVNPQYPPRFRNKVWDYFPKE